MIFIAALRHNRVDRPFVLDGPVNGEAFRAYVEQALAPTLQPGDLPAEAGGGVMGNLTSHKGQAVQKAIRNAKARLLCLPPYSPDLNPIEQGRVKLKDILKPPCSGQGVRAKWGPVHNVFSHDANDAEKCFQISGVNAINELLLPGKRDLKDLIMQCVSGAVQLPDASPRIICEGLIFHQFALR